MATIDLPEQNRNILSQKQVVILIPVTQEIEYARILLEILNAEYGNIRDVFFELLDGNTFESRSVIWRSLRRSLKYQEYRRLVEDYKSTFKRGITLSINKQESSQFDIPRINSLEEIRIKFPGKLALFNSVRSVLASGFSFTSESEYGIKKFRRVTKLLIQDYLIGENLTKKIILKYKKSDTIFIFLNGRHPSQASIRAEIESQNAEFLTLDWGEPANNRMFLAPFQIQEIEKLQSYFLESQINFSDTKKLDAITFADEWFKKQSSETLFNKYHTSLEIPATLRNQIGSGKSAIIFTSSADEELYNLRHNTNGWTSQIEAIVASSQTLMEKGFDVVVRIHPNASNKSWKDLGNTVNQLRIHGIAYILPWDKVSSYRLIEEVDLVGAWVSRIAVEAAYMQRRSFYLGVGPFSNMSGIPLICPSKLDQILEHASLKVNLESLQLAVYQNLNFGIDVLQFDASAFTNKSKTTTEKINSRKLPRVKNLIFRIINRTKRFRKRSLGPFGTPTNLSQRLRMLNSIIDLNEILKLYLEYLLKRLDAKK